MADSIWVQGAQSTIPELFARRLESDPDGEYLDVGATKLTAREVVTAADAFGAALDELGIAPGDRVATLLENSPTALLTWGGTVLHGRIAVPINTAYKGDYLAHQLRDSGARVLVVARSLLERVIAVAGGLPALEHVVVHDGDEHPPSVDPGLHTCADSARADEVASLGSVSVHRWEDLLTGPGGRAPLRCGRRTWPPSSTPAARPGCRRAAC